MAEPEEQKEGNGNLLEFPEDDLISLNQEEVDALLEIDLENNEVGVLDDLVTEALAAKLLLRRVWTGDMSRYTNEAGSDDYWKHYYSREEEKIVSSLNQAIAEFPVGFSETIKEKLRKIGVVTFRDLCLLSEEELQKVDFEDLEIKSILLILHCLKLFLMG